MKSGVLLAAISAIALMVGSGVAQAKSIKSLVPPASLSAFCAEQGLGEKSASLTTPSGEVIRGTIHCEAEDLDNTAADHHDVAEDHNHGADDDAAIDDHGSHGADDVAGIDDSGQDNGDDTGDDHGGQSGNSGPGAGGDDTSGHSGGSNDSSGGNDGSHSGRG